MEAETKLVKTITFRITKEQADDLASVVKREDRRLADVARRLFLRGLRLARRQ